MAPLFSIKLFNKADWLKPEFNYVEYHLHLLILAAVALGILQYFFGGEMFTLRNILLSWPILLSGDFVAHTLLQLD
jgi:hypothetical protein